MRSLGKELDMARCWARHGDQPHARRCAEDYCSDVHGAWCVRLANTAPWRNWRSCKVGGPPVPCLHRPKCCSIATACNSRQPGHCPHRRGTSYRVQFVPRPPIDAGKIISSSSAQIPSRWAGAAAHQAAHPDVAGRVANRTLLNELHDRPLAGRFMNDLPTTSSFLKKSDVVFIYDLLHHHRYPPHRIFAAAILSG